MHMYWFDNSYTCQSTLIFQKVTHVNIPNISWCCVSLCAFLCLAFIPFVSTYLQTGNTDSQTNEDDRIPFQPFFDFVLTALEELMITLSEKGRKDADLP